MLYTKFLFPNQINNAVSKTKEHKEKRLQIIIPRTSSPQSSDINLQCILPIVMLPQAKQIRGQRQDQDTSSEYISSATKTIEYFQREQGKLNINGCILVLFYQLVYQDS
jgi:hypothetical protein